MKRLMIFGVSVFVVLLAISILLLKLLDGAPPNFNTYFGMAMATIAITDFIANKRYINAKRIMENKFAFYMFIIGIILCFGGLAAVAIFAPVPEYVFGFIVAGFIMIIASKYIRGLNIN